MNKENYLPFIYYAFRRNPPKARGTVYHYTSKKTLKKILKDNFTLKFTQYDYLDDYTEGKVIIKVYKSICDELHRENKIENHFYEKIYQLEPRDQVRKVVKNIVVYLTEAVHFVCCFCIDGDANAMWNSYIKNNKREGFSIGFTIDNMKPKNLDYEIQFYKVIYDEKEKRKLLREYILELNDEKRISIEDKQLQIKDFLSSYRLIFKDEGFNYENEIRAILSISPEDYNVMIKDDKKENISKPYILVQFDKSIMIDIITSPKYKNEKEINSIKKTLENKGYNISIEKSKLPLR